MSGKRRISTRSSSAQRLQSGQVALAMDDANLRLPAKLQLLLIDAVSSEPVQRIAVTMTIFARERNDYHLGLPLSNSDGMIEITDDWVREGVEASRNLLLMDYATPLKQCKSIVDFEVMSTEAIQAAISAMRLYGIEKGAPGIAPSVHDLGATRNAEFEPKSLPVRLDDGEAVTRQVEVRLARRQ